MDTGTSVNIVTYLLLCPQTTKVTSDHPLNLNSTPLPIPKFLSLFDYSLAGDTQGVGEIGAALRTDWGGGGVGGG